jgi:starch synthase
LKIVQIAAEIAPIAKVGGLGDVVGGLSQSLCKDNNVQVLLPKYVSINTKLIKNLKIYKKNFKVYEKRRYQKVNIYLGYLNDIKIYLIEDSKYFTKPKIYGYKSDVARFLFFCKSVLEFLKEQNEKIDILHIHDWHTAMIAGLYKKYYKKELFIKKIILSIHNIQYQGHCKTFDIKNIGFTGKFFLKPDLMQDPERPRTLNLLKGGFVFSDFIIPVSKTYAKEILEKENGFGLEKIAKKYKRKIKGIVNGIDMKCFEPKSDKFLKYKFSEKTSLFKLKDIKAKNKKILRDILNLDNLDLPIVCSIGRIVFQKGPRLILDATDYIAKEKKAQFVLLGSIFEKNLQKPFLALKKRHKKNPNISIRFEYNEKLAHLIYASADFIIVPSFFEPCGLTQLIAFKYGCMPIVRKTGGLADTVFDIGSNLSKDKKNGFVFEKFKSQDLNKTIKRALDFYNQQNDTFYQTIKKNMSLNYSWQKISKEYIAIYQKLLK